MILTLLGHQWKAFWRSRSTGRNVAMQIFLAIIIIYLVGVASLIGLSIGEILEQIFPEQDPVTIFCGFILYFFAIDVLIRFLVQDLPTLTIQPYLAHNIRRKQLITFLNIRSLFSFFTLLPLLLFAPFILTTIAKTYGGVTAMAFLVAIMGLTVFNHFFVLFIKRKMIFNNWWLVGFFGLVLTLMLLDYYQLFSFRGASAALFTTILKTPFLSLLPVVLAAAAFYNNSVFLRHHLYIEEKSRSSRYRSTAEFTWLQQMGTMGELMAIDLKLILRNKRPRSLLLLSCLFLFYGFIFYKPEYLEKEQLGMLLFGAIFITGMFMTNYGQFLFAWQSSHFDGLMATNLSLTTYIKSKFLLLTAFCTAALLLSLFYGFISWKIIPIQLAAYFFNIGIHTVLAAFIGTYNDKGLDISKGSSFNYQGIGAAQWLYALVILLVGVLLYLPFALLINAWAGVAAIGILGIANLLLQDWWIQKLSLQFMQRKHKLLAGFREK
ncbi:MAG TPA: DUF5687 family protein [Flavisolibacter sp.]|nr:DUF5687 family protein [Flavisolibacter sp.]